jgi:hypothetical protein
MATSSAACAVIAAALSGVLSYRAERDRAEHASRIAAFLLMCAAGARGRGEGGGVLPSAGRSWPRRTRCAGRPWRTLAPRGALDPPRPDPPPPPQPLPASPLRYLVHLVASTSAAALQFIVAAEMLTINTRSAGVALLTGARGEGELGAERFSKLDGWRGRWGRL